MNAYLFTGLISQYQKGHFVDACSSLIIYGGDEDTSVKVFEQWLLGPNSGEASTPTKVQRIVGAPFLEQLLTETGDQPIDWPRICAEAQQIVERTEPDEMGQGYWIDLNQSLDWDKVGPDIELLKRELPDDIRSGLNWSADKTFLFLLSILSPPAPQPVFEDYDEEEEAPTDAPDDAASQAWGEMTQEQSEAAFPELVDKELAVLVRARNSVIAAWLWKKYAVSTPLGKNLVRADAWCGAMPVSGAVTSE